MSEALVGLRVEPLDEGGYLATCAALPGLVAQGRTVAETLEIAQDVARKLIDSYQERGEPLPVGIDLLNRQHINVGIAVGLP